MCSPQLKARLAAQQGMALPGGVNSSIGGDGTANSTFSGAPNTFVPTRRGVPIPALSIAGLPSAGNLAIRPRLLSAYGQRAAAIPPAGVADLSAPMGIGANTNPMDDLSKRNGNPRSPIDALIANNADVTAAPASPSPTGRGVPQKTILDEAAAPERAALEQARLVILKRQSAPFQPSIPERRPYIEGILTDPADRAWLPAVEAKRGSAVPYPTGTAGSPLFTAAERAAMRIRVGYLYTLPEVKAFLDVLSTTEGSEEAGYYRSHWPSKTDLADLSSYHSKVPIGRYQIDPQMYKDYGQAWFSRTDFSPVTQDVIAIAALVRDGAIDRLLAGDLRGAFSAASHTFASVPTSAVYDHSGFQGSHWSPEIDDPNYPERQSTRQHFDELPGIFLARLNSRRAEQAQLRQAWQKNGAIPWAALSPFRWRQFGRQDF